MKIKGTLSRISYAENGIAEVTFAIPNRKEALEIKKQVGELSIEIKKWTNPRSLEANRYMWEIIGKIANALTKDADDIYLEMLATYGQYDTLCMWEPSVNAFMAYYKLAKEVGKTTVDGKPFVWLRAYRGSSTYDTNEMAKLIDGVVQEAQDLGIETRTPEQLAELKSLWATKEKAQ